MSVVKENLDAVMSDNKRAAKMLQIILNTNLEVLFVEKGYDGAYNVLGMDDISGLYDIQVRTLNVAKTIDEAHMYIRLMEAEQRFAIGERYLIFITETDILGQNLPLYNVQKTVMETGQPYFDSLHIVFLNTAYKKGVNTDKDMIFDKIKETIENR